MSLVTIRPCPIPGCKFNRNPVASDLAQLKRHLKYDHDYKEKQETALSLGLIDSLYEKRSPSWFVDSLSDFSRV
ncbi:MAG: hypothetical protein IIC67_05095 [Thaumarchaeota archaeon]|nr:hypothetical protein [Nitrososphaerota archaeon]